MKNGLMLMTWLLIFLMGAPHGGEQAKVRDTLENQAFLTGTAEEGTRIICSVYVSNEKESALLYRTEQLVGAEGLYEVTAPLPVLGRQYVVLQVGKREEVYLYQRYRKQLAQDLKGYYLNIYEALDHEEP